MMYCIYCGGENEDGSIYCCECGKSIGDASVQNQQPVYFGNPQQNPQTTTPQEHTITITSSDIAGFFKKNLALILMVLIIVGLLIGGICVVSYLTAPERIVEKYFSALKAEDWDGAYDCLYVAESEFINREQFALAMEKEPLLADHIASYEINEDSGSYVIEYATDLSPKNSMTVELVEMGEKKFLLFPSYKVSAANMITSLNLTAPYYTEAYLDGISLNDSSSVDSYVEGSLCSYQISSVFRFPHEVFIRSDVTEDFVTETSSDLYVNFYDLTMKPQTQEDIHLQAQSDFTQLFSAAANGDDLAGDHILYENYHDYFYDYLYSPTAEGIHDIQLTGTFVTSEQEYVNEYLSYECAVEYTFDYNYYYYDEEYQKTERKWIDILRFEDRSSQGTAYFLYTYDIRTGSWMLSEISYNSFR